MVAYSPLFCAVSGEVVRNIIAAISSRQSARPARKLALMEALEHNRSQCDTAAGASLAAP